MPWLVIGCIIMYTLELGNNVRRLKMGRIAHAYVFALLHTSVLRARGKTVLAPPHTHVSMHGG